MFEKNCCKRSTSQKQTLGIHDDKRKSLSALRSLGRRLAVAATMLAFVASQGWGSPHKRSAKSAGTDPGYVLALGTADHFLHAWEAGDLETGMVLLSDRVRHTHSADTLEEFFLAGQDRGFEIMRGSGHAGRYRFPVALLTRQGTATRRVATEIILVSTGKNEWAVDKLP